MKKLTIYILILNSFSLCYGDEVIKELSIFNKIITLPETCRLKHIDDKGQKDISCYADDRSYLVFIYTFIPEKCEKNEMLEGYKMLNDLKSKIISEKYLNNTWYFEVESGFDGQNIHMYDRTIRTDKECIHFKANTKKILDNQLFFII